MTSSSITPSELASLMGLSPGLDGPAGPVMTSEEATKVNRLIVASDLSQEFWAAFCSDYLPSLHRTLLAGVEAAALIEPSFSRLQSFYILSPIINAFNAAAISSHNWHRFVREHSSDVRDTFWTVLRSLKRFPLDVAEIDHIPKSCLTNIGLILAILAEVFAADPPLSQKDLPSFSAEEKRAISLRLPLLSSSSDRIPPSDVHIVSYIQELTMQEWDLVAWTSRFSSENWEICALALSGPNVTTSCCKASEMKVCARCLSSLYCSREHQKLDWKRHKKLCFPAGW
ncbi:hypothetical protein BDY24DRAFT_395492 [Mrakia frigida]|uniref:zinc finger MYND domain-containing protein n=1 Tax=Mrakia frigida TaxID=29902 RepID=UPI003FCC0368